MPISLFGRDEERPKKPSFFQRVRQAVTGEPAPVVEPEPARPEPVATPAKVPAPIPLGSTPEDAFAAPESAAELAEVEGVETPGVDAFAVAESAAEPQTFDATQQTLIVHDNARLPE